MCEGSCITTSPLSHPENYDKIWQILICDLVLSFWMCLVFGLILSFHLLHNNISEKDTVIVRVTIMCEKSFWCPQSLPPITTVFLRAEPILLFVKAVLPVEVGRDMMPSWSTLNLFGCDIGDVPGLIYLLSFFCYRTSPMYAGYICMIHCPCNQTPGVY